MKKPRWAVEGEEETGEHRGLSLVTRGSFFRLRRRRQAWLNKVLAASHEGGARLSLLLRESTGTRPRRPPPQVTTLSQGHSIRVLSMVSRDSGIYLKINRSVFMFTQCKHENSC